MKNGKIPFTRAWPKMFFNISANSLDFWPATEEALRIAPSARRRQAIVLALFSPGTQLSAAHPYALSSSHIERGCWRSKAAVAVLQKH